MPRVIPAFKQFFAFNSTTGVLEPLVDGWLQFYATGTTSTPKDTYSDLLETIPNTNPLQLDSEGRCPDVFGTGSYKVVSYSNDPATDAPSVQIESFDPVPGTADTNKVLISANDTTAGVLNGKLSFGDGIQATELDDGGNESLFLTIIDRVRMTEDETIAGVKTFSSSPIVPTPTTDAQAANKEYVDDTLASTAPTAVADAIPSGTSMLFNQASPPVSWTKKTNWAANASVVVGNTYAAPAGTDSPASWTTAIAVGNHTTHTHTGPSHTHTGPSHTHSVEGIIGAVGGSLAYRLDSLVTGAGGTGNTGAGGTGNTGAGGPTTHTVTQDTYTPIYTVVVAATKNAYS